LIGQLIQGEPDFTEPIRQSFENVIEFAPASDGVRGHKLIVGPANLLVEFDMRPAAKTASLGVFVKNAADEERVITNVCAKQKSLLGSGAGQRDQDIRNILLSAIANLVGNLQLIGARERFKQRRDIIAKLAVADSALLQDMPGKNVKIKLGRDPQMAAVI